jgi:phosphotransferase system IIB component
MLPILLQMVGYDNKKMTADQFARTIDEVGGILADPKPRINITNITPVGVPAVAGTTTPPTTPARGGPPTTPARGGPPTTPAGAAATPAGAAGAAATPAGATPAGAASSASTSGWWPIGGWGGWGSSGTTGTLGSPSLPSTMTIQVKNSPKTIHIYNSTSKNNLYIKIGENGSVKKVMYSKTSDGPSLYKAINFTNVKSSTSENAFKNVLAHVGISLNDNTYQQVFGTDTDNKISSVYTHLEKVIKDKIPKTEFFTHSDGIVGYGIINDNIPKQVNFGKNIILLNKLYYKNILSVKDQNLHAVEYLPNVKVSDNFVDIIFSMTKNKQPSKETINNLSTDEQHLLDTLLYISGIKSASVSSNKDDIIKELKDKLRLAEGQIKAGNDNPLVKEELKDIIKKLYLYNVVSLKNSKEYLKQF